MSHRRRCRCCGCWEWEGTPDPSTLDLYIDENVNETKDGTIVFPDEAPADDQFYAEIPLTYTTWCRTPGLETFVVRVRVSDAVHFRLAAQWCGSGAEEGTPCFTIEIYEDDAMLWRQGFGAVAYNNFVGSVLIKLCYKRGQLSGSLRISAGDYGAEEHSYLVNVAEFTPRYRIDATLVPDVRWPDGPTYGYGRIVASPIQVYDARPGCHECGPPCGACLAVAFSATSQRVADQIRRCECARTVKLGCLSLWNWGGTDNLDRQLVSFSITKEGERYLGTLRAADLDNAVGGPGAGYAEWTADLGESEPDPYAINCTASLTEDGGLGCVPAPEVQIASLPANDPCENPPGDYGCNAVCDCGSRAKGGPSVVAVAATGFGKTLPDSTFGGADREECLAMNRTAIMPVTSGAENCAFSFQEGTSGPNWWTAYRVQGIVGYTPSTGKVTITVEIYSGAGSFGYVLIACHARFAKTLDARINCNGGPAIELDLAEYYEGYCEPGRVTYQVLS